MGRMKKSSDDRPTTTTRLYQDTVRILKLLAEAQDLTMADYIDKLAKEAAERDAHLIQDVIDAYRVPPAKGGK